jgi:hypothetical protein
MLRPRNLFLNNDSKQLKLQQIAQNLDIPDAGIKTNAEMLGYWNAGIEKKKTNAGCSVAEVPRVAGNSGIKGILSFFKIARSGF